jgi:uncharacterized protein (TIGR02996 family)
MSDFLALIRACKAEPDDDAPRLVLADWLEDHGDAERAAFIRRQVSGAADEAVPANPGWAGEWGRWAEQRNTNSNNEFCRAAFRRGFLYVSDYYSELYDDLRLMLRPPFDWTWVEGVKFGSWHDGDWSHLFESPRLLELNWLEFIDDHYHSDLVPPLVKCPYLSNLRHLRFLMIRPDGDGLRQLSQAASLSGLRSFLFEDSGAGRRGARAFAESELWDNLTHCSFQVNSFGDTALAELAAGHRRRRLETLDLRYGRYSDAGLVQFARSESYPNLSELRIGYSTLWIDRPPRFGPFGIESLLKSPTGWQGRLVVAVQSHEPVPGEIMEVAAAYPDRVGIEYWNPRQGRPVQLFPPRG